MNDPQQQEQKRDSLETGPLDPQASYPSSIEKMSERWREVQQQGRQQEGQQPRGFVERNSIALGVGLALLIIALLVVIGGFAFLVWNAR